MITGVLTLGGLVLGVYVYDKFIRKPNVKCVKNDGDLDRYVKDAINYTKVKDKT